MLLPVPLSRHAIVTFVLSFGLIWWGAEAPAVAASHYTFTTMAGFGAVGSADGTGTAARFAEPRAVAVDNSGNLYVADRGNNTIRMITPGGVVTTVAGTPGVRGSADGTGSAASFNNPDAITVDNSTGNLYVSDTGNCTIRKIAPGAVVTTFAGAAGQCGFNNGAVAGSRWSGPEGIAVDPTGRVIVADNTVIRVISTAGMVSNIAGTPGSPGTTDGVGGAARFSRPTGIALDNSTSPATIYVSDAFANTIRKIAPGQMVTTFAGSPFTAGTADGTGFAARFDRPWGVAVDAASNVYVADSNGVTIRKITPARVVSTFAGTPGAPLIANGLVTGFLDPRGLAINSAGTLYVTDGEGSTMWTVSPAGAVTQLAGAAGSLGHIDGTGSVARFGFPSGVVVGPGGDLFVTEYASTIRKVTQAGLVTTLAGSVLNDGSADGTGSAAQFHGLTGVAIDAAGNLFVVDQGNNTIRKVTPAGVVTTIAGSPGNPGSADGTGSAARFNDPNGIAIDSAGNLYVTDTGNFTIRKITPAGVVSTFAGTAGQSGTTDATGAAARFNGPTYVAVDSGGTLYVTDPSVIRKITPARVVTTLAGSFANRGNVDGTGSAAQFDSPTGIAVDTAGNLFVMDASAQTVRMITPAGVVTTVGGVPYVPGSTDGPGPLAKFAATGIAVDAVGTLYIADTQNNTMRRGTRPIARDDFDGDAKFDITVYRPTTGQWFMRQSHSGFGTGDYLNFQWGLPGDLPMQADFDGDGQTDLVVDRPSTGEWFIRYSSQGYSTNTFGHYQWGLSGDTPIVADFDGDGKADIAVYRPSTGQWFILFSSQGYATNTFGLYQWGLSGDTPIVADFDADGKAELTVFRPTTGEWFIRYSTQAYSTGTFGYYQWGLSGDTALVADFDGDGKAEVTVYRPSTGEWFIRYSSQAYNTNTFGLYQWGLSGDTPMIMDLDGDGKAELTVFRPSTGEWFIRYSAQAYNTNTFGLYQWGLVGDTALPKN